LEQPSRPWSSHRQIQINSNHFLDAVITNFIGEDTTALDQASLRFITFSSNFSNNFISKLLVTFFVTISNFISKLDFVGCFVLSTVSGLGAALEQGSVIANYIRAAISHHPP
jgi:hypothetical protein